MASDRDFNPSLSEAGRRRAARMRDELIGDMRRVHRRRRQRRNAAVAMLLLAVVGGWWLIQSPQRSVPRGSTPTPAPRIAHGPSKPSSHVQPLPAPFGEVTIAIVNASPPTRIERIRSDPAVLNRYRAQDRPPEYVTYLSDEQLVNELAAIGEPVSVVRLPDRVLLVRAEERGRQSAE